MNAEMTGVARERFEKVIPYVKARGPRGRREEAGTGGSETMLTSCRWLCKGLLVAGQWGTALSSLLACPQEEQKLLICFLSWARSQGLSLDC